ncbi:MAG: hypothetical protein Q8Q81_00585 [Oxalobacteraceae bacterium]|nr:hypothetical protein [Oxalobacteraceae bacterium]
MTNLINFILAVIVWLGLFEVHLIKPLAVLPITTVMATLTAVDYLLLALCFIAVTVISQIFDHFTSPKKQQSAEFVTKVRVLRRNDFRGKKRPW